MKAKVLGRIVGAFVAFAPFVSFAAGLPAPVEGSSTLQAEGVVKSVDRAKHSVTVRDAQGGEASFEVTEKGSIDRIRQGEKVHVRMTRNAMISVLQDADGQAAPAAVTSQNGQANPEQNVNAQVQAVDHATGVVALKGPNGPVFYIQGRVPAQMANLTPGMQVMVALAPQVSVTVAPAQ
ncbi:hypothetical protein EN871_27345 [bacterium M00.F.Ca.ET.228.01.1.1]|uniref:hypothetical protein n=1 Tax=Paraburkholderia phenoliruptrix TaxID=252970 RepID=UPI00109287C1|nr:hypothetical protein [Paraburkholderia phenoliruptrix]TGP40756.1 hypothetical protein EN871_27345 [bacterium M00.F.Ca.ET.228.01.1.1]TGR97007.1 hypothetical protein EN834_26960 [bacterium M00.F.Ca.ET.191.01.1.1]TGT98317.1 hypothetical protein EN798_26965 [bacterium M00.F.Ca.ET.155.01.1.1]MBW0448260.1 hypothetical protein [Paraburkholderia phenoliruptrix]MBW9100367.1 hypothetical protein [Paraburkholderia phenoliruptrix]